MTTTSKPSVLFVCVHNARRPQTVAGFLRHAGDAVEVRSAGSAPADQINPVAMQAIAETGIDITDQKLHYYRITGDGRMPKVLTQEASRAPSVVITVGRGDGCPYFRQRHEDWQLDDPAGQRTEAVRKIRDAVRRRVETFIAEISAAN